MNARTFFSELKRRRVYSVAVAYVVTAWLLIQVATQVFPFFNIPNWIVRLIVLLAIIGFPIAVVCSWAFEITPEGIKLEEDVDRRISRKTGRKLTALIVIVAAVAAGVMVFASNIYNKPRKSRNKRSQQLPSKVNRSPFCLLKT